MEVETTELPEGTEIRVKTDRKVAVVVKGDGERIYLPSGQGDDSTYYLEEPEQLVKTESGYQVVHRGEIEDITVLG